MAQVVKNNRPVALFGSNPATVPPIYPAPPVTNMFTNGLSFPERFWFKRKSITVRQGRNGLKPTAPHWPSGGLPRRMLSAVQYLQGITEDRDTITANRA